MPRPQHSPMLGQRASSQTVCRPPLAHDARAARAKRPCRDGARTVIHGGARLLELRPRHGRRRRQRARARGRTPRRARCRSGPRTSAVVTGRPVSPRDRREPGAAQAAGVEQVVDAEVEVDVDGKAVARHPARAANADRGDLAVVDPDAALMRLCERAALDAELGQRRDDRLLQAAHVAAQVAAARVQVEDRVADELARAVVGRAAAAADLDDLDAAARRTRRRRAAAPRPARRASRA